MCISLIINHQLICNIVIGSEIIIIVVFTCILLVINIEILIKVYVINVLEMILTNNMITHTYEIV